MRIMEHFTLYSSTGQPIRDIAIELFRPRMDVLVLGRRHFVWREEVQQYREATAYVIPITE